MVRRYVHGPGIDEPLVAYDGAGTTNRRFLIADVRGSIVAATNSTGTLLALASYDEYGVRSGGDVGRFQYTGQLPLPGGLTHYKARTYAPGR